MASHGYIDTPFNSLWGRIELDEVGQEAGYGR